MKLYRWSLLAMLGAILLLPATSHATITYLGLDYEQAIWSDTGGTGFDNARNFSFPGFASGVTGTAIATKLSSYSNGAGIVGTHNPTGATNFPSDNTGPNYDSPYYSPSTFEANRKWLNVGVGRLSGPDTTMMSITLDLSGNTAAQRFIVDFQNLDNASAYFVSATDISNNVYTGAALKALISPYLGNYGSPTFEHSASGTYYTVNATRQLAWAGGLQDSDGNNPTGGGGAVLVNLPLKQLVLEFDDMADWSSSGDGFLMTMMAVVPEPSSISLIISGLAGIAVMRRRRKGPKRVNH